MPAEQLSLFDLPPAPATRPNRPAERAPKPNAAGIPAPNLQSPTPSPQPPAFLRTAAEKVFTAHDGQMDHIWVVLPTRRAVNVFGQELARLAGQTGRPMLAPHLLGVDDFISEASGLQLIDPVGLLFLLFDVFREIDPLVNFDQFMGWATVLLADFDRIDQQMVKPSEVFSYVTAAQALERWTLELPSTAKPLGDTPMTSRYFRLFENLQVAYDTLRERLRADGLAYRGMAYRHLAEQIGPLVRDNPIYEKLYFVGINALSKAEERMLDTLVKAHKAELIWDVDTYYLEDKNQEAGRFVQRYREQGWPGLSRNFLQNDLLGRERRVRVIGSPNASLQAKIAGQLVNDWQADDRRDVANTDWLDESRPAKRTAIILADETLLVPVLYSLDETIEQLNVTMGLSLRHSMLFTLVDALFELQRTVAEIRTADGRDLKIPKFHHRQVIKILNHPFIRQYERVHNLTHPADEKGPHRSLLAWVMEEITAKQWVYLDEKELRALGGDNPLFTTLFTRWKPDKPRAVIRWFYELIDLLRDVYRHNQDALEIEYLYLFHSLLQQMEATLERSAQDPDATPLTVASLRKFLNELIRQTTMPFTSEGDAPVQLMGLLETRALDFERVIILSANEGILPAGRRSNSLIPFEFSVKHNLPTYVEQEAVMAYHFYRLLQRAEDVALIYTTSPDAYGGSKGEPSRFVYQLQYELVPRTAGRTVLTEHTVAFAPAEQPALNVAELKIPRTADIQHKLKKMLTEHGLYPTALSQFVSCSMRFYFARVVGVSEDEDVEERMGAAEFGDWLHKTLELIDNDYRMQHRPVTEDVIDTLLRKTYVEQMRGRVAEQGINLLLYDTARALMHKFLAGQNELAGLEVIATEQKLETYVNVALDGGETLRIKLAGKADRIERYGGTLRIIDYKTGKVQLPANPPNDLRERLRTDGEQDKMRQLWLYKYLALKNMAEQGGFYRNKERSEFYPVQNEPVEAGFYSFRDKEHKLIANPVVFAPNETAEQFISSSEEIIADVVRDILADTPFEKTATLETCKYCDYKRICGR